MADPQSEALASAIRQMQRHVDELRKVVANNFTVHIVVHGSDLNRALLEIDSIAESLEQLSFLCREKLAAPIEVREGDNTSDTDIVSLCDIFQWEDEQNASPKSFPDGWHDKGWDIDSDADNI